MRAPHRPGVVADPGMHASSLYGNREISSSATCDLAEGPHREGEEPKPMMYELEKSDLCIVAKKPANDGAGSTSELVERRRRAKGNMGKTCAHRTLSRASVSPGLDRVRERARRMLASSSLTQGGSRVPESGPLGSVRGAPSNGRPYRDPALPMRIRVR